MIDLSGRTILLVDDEPVILDVIEGVLAMDGCTILKADNGQSALELIYAQPVDIVISDVRMPIMDGLTLLDHVRNMPEPKPAVVLISAFSDIEVEMAIQRGADALLKKPFDMGTLEGRVQQTLQKRDAPKAAGATKK